MTAIVSRPTSAGPVTRRGAGGGVQLSPVDARVLRAVDPSVERTVARVAKLAGCAEDIAASSLKRLRGRMLIEPDGSRPTGWLRTREGDLMLEHQP